jgi:hypothetical protein
VTVLSRFWQAAQDHKANVALREFLAEREEMLQHKRLESEKTGIFATGIAYEQN